MNTNRDLLFDGLASHIGGWVGEMLKQSRQRVFLYDHHKL